MAEEATAASRSLSQESGQLSDLVGEFKICQTGETSAVRGRAQKASPHADRALRASA
jgi:methyl-accepting chemotaxis protein